MSKSLVIVESPAKARTIRKYLGSSFNVKASLGHLKDLPKAKMGVNVDKDFSPEYRIIPGKKKILNELVKSAMAVDDIYLALDPDREGEAIAWHIYEELKDLDKNIQRVLFNEITKKGITEGLSNPHPINLKRYESQQARRILDRLVGYEISPVLWKKVRRGLSAGRVQSVALRLVVDREKEIKVFIPDEFWKIEAMLKGPVPPDFKARYFGQKSKKTEIKDGQTAEKIKEELKNAQFVVDQVDRKERKRSAPAPFITSRLQQEMAKRFRFTAKRTMVIAQQLYEGIDIGEEGTVGLITYMRTDSVRLSDDSVTEARDYIEKTFGKKYVPAKPNIFKTKKSAQDAHEAIRPTSVNYTPDSMAKYLSRDQLKLYKVIWERLVACQMKPAVYDQTIVHIKAAEHFLRVSGSVLKFSGWFEVTENKDASLKSPKASNDDDDDSSAELPPLKEGEVLELIGEGVSAEQKFTQPPARFSEGTLIRELEERGIGRPSTYATIMSTIIDRRYVEKDEGKLKPSELGEIVIERLVEHFPRILDADFTASMEESLDKVEDGTQDWVKLLANFYEPFKLEVSTALKNMKDVKELTKETDKICEKCGAKMLEKWGRNGRFLACSAYPQCRNTMEIDGTKKDEGVVEFDIKCETCGKEMVRKRGRFGDFLACSGYPECKTTRSMPTGICCPKEGCDGELLERRTKKGRLFYGCSNYAKTACDFVVWGNPVLQDCPECGATFLLATARKNNGRTLKCVAQGCTFTKIEAESGS